MITSMEDDQDRLDDALLPAKGILIGIFLAVVLVWLPIAILILWLYRWF